VADVTTHSPEAYRYYLEGEDYFHKLYSIEAEKSYRKALEFDSTFAMAYFRLAYLKSGSERKELLAEAVEYSHKASEKERHYIKSLEASISRNYTQAIAEAEKIVERYPKEKEAFYWLGEIYYGLRQFEETIHYYTQAIEIDPLYKPVYNDLSYAYHKIGDFEKSIWAINKYISLAPDEANPYDSRGELYAYNGKLDQAIESYKKALEIKPDFYWSLMSLGHMYVFKREYARAESCYKELCSSGQKNTRSRGRTYLAFIPLYQGKFEDALKVLDDGIAADRMEQTEGAQNAIKHFTRAEMYGEKGNLNLAGKEAEKAVEIWHRANPYDKVYWRHYYVWLLVENNHLEKAEEVADALRKDIGEEDQTLMYSYWYSLGCIELGRGNLQASLINFEKAAKDASSFYMRFTLAKAYLESDRLGEAVSELEKVLSKYDEGRIHFTIWAVKAYYLLGLAYEKSGWNKKAIEQYEEFLEIWKDADPGIPEVDDAKERLEKLRVES
jgi:tetratricopeptide (TPR) repeat protein